MRPLAKHATVALAALLLAFGAPGGGATAQDATSAVAALKRLSDDPRADIGGALNGIKFNEALYILDELSYNEQRKLRQNLDRFGLEVSSEIESAIRAKAPRRRGGPGGGPGR